VSDERFDAATAEILQKRALRLRRPLSDGEEEAVHWFAEFPVGDLIHALPLSSLCGAVPLKSVTPVPLSAPHVLGILRFGGQIISAMSLSALLGGRGWKVDPAVLLVVDPGFGQPIALDCEQIPRAVALPPSAISVPSGNAWTEIATPDGRLLRVIDLKVLLNRRGEARRGR
jgi:chemotaxis signal transduction protein